MVVRSLKKRTYDIKGAAQSAQKPIQYQNWVAAGSKSTPGSVQWKDSRSKTAQTSVISTSEETSNAMSRKLEGMAEEAVLSGGRSAMKNLEEAGFSEEQKKRLLERVNMLQNEAFRSNNQQAFSIATMPSSAGTGTQDAAAATTLDRKGVSSRHDANRPIKLPSRIPNPVNLQPTPTIRLTPGGRIRSAMESSQMYEVKEGPNSNLTSHEREEYAKELRERFTPFARPMPMTPQGLSNLANEKIQAAISRGEFSKIKRGKGINTEHADNQFVDTTEFLMNRILKNQEVTPPWIEKQQGLTFAIRRFRADMWKMWSRHALYLIRKQANSLDDQLRYAKAYAAAEKGEIEASLPDVPRLRDEIFEKTHRGSLTSARSIRLCVNPTLVDKLVRCFGEEKEAKEKKRQRAGAGSSGKGFWSLFGL
ncbi:hypothetical protein KEM54_004665 [Ascosphaera aggregata]|nr:hypothetical protein KEM54_004665 [Ascosphaera aggregata]